VALGLGIGVAAGTSDFGLLGGPRSRLVRTDAAVELRGRPPLAWRGFAAQAAAGCGRLQLAYRPDRIVLDVGSGPIPVTLDPVGVWTWQLAAEVLHPVPGGELGLRCGWRSYALRVATPAGTESRPVRDLQLGLVLRVSLVR
jgi:hypothetical protein